MQNILQDFQNWGRSNSKTEPGWETDFPHWDMLVDYVSRQLQSKRLSNQEYEQIEEIININEEREDILDMLKENHQLNLSLVYGFLDSRYPSVRWQMCVLLGEIYDYDETKKEVLNTLEKCLHDSDEYVKRRALLELIKFVPPDKKKTLLLEFQENTSDDYNKMIAERLLSKAS